MNTSSTIAYGYSYHWENVSMFSMNEFFFFYLTFNLTLFSLFYGKGACVSHKLFVPLLNLDLWIQMNHMTGVYTENC